MFKNRSFVWQTKGLKMMQLQCAKKIVLAIAVVIIMGGTTTIEI